MVVTDAIRTITTAVYVPSILINRKRLNDDAQFSWLLRSHIVNIFLVTLVCTFIAMCFADTFVKTLAPGFSEETLVLTTNLLRILLLTLPLGIMLSILSSLFNGYGHFAKPELINQLPRALLVATLLLLIPPYGVVLLCIVMVLGTLIGFTLILKSSIKFLGPFFTAAVNANNNNKVGKFDTHGLFLPILLMQGYGILVVWIDYAFASSTNTGGVSMLEYGQRLIQMLPGTIAGSIVTVMYTKFAQQKTYGHAHDTLLASLVTATRKGLLVLAPITLFMSITSSIIVNLVLNHGAFTDEAATITAGVMSLYAPSIVMSFLINLSLAALYVDKNAPQVKITLVMVVVGLLSRIIMDFYFLQQWGLYGISLAASLSSALVLITIYPMMTRYWGRHYGQTDIVELIKIIFICLTLGIVLLLTQPLLNFGRNGFLELLLQLAALGIISGVTFVTTACIVRSKDFFQISNKLLQTITNR